MSKEEFQKSVYYWYAQELETKLDIINVLFYMQGEHKNSFDEENLKFVLEKTGFYNVVMRKFDKELDMGARENESMYLECEKLGVEV